MGMLLHHTMMRQQEEQKKRKKTAEPADSVATEENESEYAAVTERKTVTRRKATK